ncbi:MAG: alpha/beta hydrolase [Maricaulis sp.]|nr:alpha/beta hydrolase [Maricaulis sp.]HAQ36113.1 alpha/beta hydrolase [Alphaproteobacteria bacterium]
MAAGWDRRDLVSPTGATLALYETAPAAPVKGIVHINHGLAEHAARYAPFARYLAERGWHVAAQDHRGHGFTSTSDGGPRRFSDREGWRKVTEDTAAVNAHLRAGYPGKPVFVLGHSMGGTVAMNHVVLHPDTVAGAAIWNANFVSGGLAGVMKLVLFANGLGGAHRPAGMIDALTFKTWDRKFSDERPEFGWLSRDLSVVDAYVADPLCGWPASVSLWRDFLAGMARAADDDALKSVPRSLPFHLVGGSEDPATEGGKATRDMAQRLKRRGFADVTLNVFEGFRHETLNEIGADIAMSNFADWLDQRAG